MENLSSSKSPNYTLRIQIASVPIRLANKIKYFFMNSFKVVERSAGWITKSFFKSLIVNLLREGERSSWCQGLNLFLSCLFIFLELSSSPFLQIHHKTLKFSSLLNQIGIKSLKNPSPFFPSIFPSFFVLILPFNFFFFFPNF